MQRQARIERRMIVELADGSTVTLDPGECWLDDDGSSLRLSWRGPQGRHMAGITPETLSRHLQWHDLVFTSW